jgi:hypothetical protein
MYEAYIETTQRDELIEAVTRLFVATDDRDWERVRSCFADRVLFDMGSGNAGYTTPEAIITGWTEGLSALKSIHHQVGNFLVDIQGGSAGVSCYGIAFHYLPNRTNMNTRTFVGSYDLHLRRGDEGWEIDAFTYHPKFIEGNISLEKAGE